MARITCEQEAATDVLDRLLFNQILVFCAFSESERDWLARVTESVSRAVGETGVAGLQAECLKHGVLCLMEIFLSDGGGVLTERFAERSRFPLPEGFSWENFRELEAHTRNYFAGFALCVWTKIRGDVMECAADIATSLVKVFQDAPASVRYRLAERCLAYEFQRAPVDCLAWLAEFGLIRSTKYKSDRVVTPPKGEVLARIGMLCEFEILRKTVWVMANKKANFAEMISENMPHVLSCDAELKLIKIASFTKEMAIRSRYSNKFRVFLSEKVWDEFYVKGFFAELRQHLMRFRILKKSQANLVGDLGAAAVEIKLRASPDDASIYYYTKNDGKITDAVMKDLKNSGLTITGRTLWQKHLDFKKSTLELINSYYKTITDFGTANNLVTDDFYYFLAIPYATSKPGWRFPTSSEVFEKMIARASAGWPSEEVRRKPPKNGE